MGSGLCKLPVARLGLAGMPLTDGHCPGTCCLANQDVAVILVTLTHMASHRHNTH